MAAEIRVRGAREHNLRDIDIDLPLGRLVVITGVSGSGKSSLAFDTVHAEAQRRFVEALGVQLRGLENGLRRPAVDRIDGLPPSVALDQRPRQPGPWDSVAIAAGVAEVFGVLWGRAGTLYCPGCGDAVHAWTHDAIVGALAGVPDGSRLFIEAPIRAETPAGVLDEVARAGFSRVRVDGTVRRLDELAPRDVHGPVRIVVDRVRMAPGREARLHDAVRTAVRAGAGRMVAVVDGEERWYAERPWCAACDRPLPALRPRLLSPRSADGSCSGCGGTGRVTAGACAACGGVGLSDVARAVRVGGWSAGDALGGRVDSLHPFVQGLSLDATAEGAREELAWRLGQLVTLGLGHLRLATRAAAVATGERQRLRLARQVAARLSGVLYVLDEPTAGLHPDDVAGVVALLRQLVARGNTVVAVEHDAAVVRAADRVIDFGPGAGPEGGRVVFDGPPAALVETDTATGRWLAGRDVLPGSRGREPVGALRLGGLSQGVLTDMTVELPLGCLLALTGASGSGKTTLVDAALGHLAAHLGTSGPPAPPVRELAGLDAVRRVLVVREGASRSARSSPATYTGLWTILRTLLASTREAQVRGLQAAAFSLNVKGGRCESCAGSGVRRVDLDVLPDVSVPCEVCEGRRFTGDVLEVRWKGRAPDELLALSADAAHVLLAGHPKLEAILRALRDVGLGYLPLGLPADALSGGEANRLKLARELARARRGSGDGVLYVLDHPSQGLHPADVAHLLGLLQLLVDEGASVWMATHHAGLIAAADRIVALGSA